MSWSGFRPSDDTQQYGYNVPVNMYAQAALERALELNAALWRRKDFEERASMLAQGMREGGWTASCSQPAANELLCSDTQARLHPVLQALSSGALSRWMARGCMPMKWMAWAANWCDSWDHRSCCGDNCCADAPPVVPCLTITC